MKAPGWERNEGEQEKGEIPRGDFETNELQEPISFWGGFLHAKGRIIMEFHAWEMPPDRDIKAYGTEAFSIHFSCLIRPANR